MKRTRNLTQKAGLMQQVDLDVEGVSRCPWQPRWTPYSLAAAIACAATLYTMWRCWLHLIRPPIR